MSQQEYHSGTESSFLIVKEKNKKVYLTQTEKQAIDYELSLVPYKKAALIEALKIVQQHRGWISDDSVEAIAEY
jgi:NADH:ubiquinone oxidoreductase subunit E